MVQFSEEDRERFGFDVSLANAQARVVTLEFIDRNIAALRSRLELASQDPAFAHVLHPYTEADHRTMLRMLEYIRTQHPEAAQ